MSVLEHVLRDGLVCDVNNDSAQQRLLCLPVDLVLHKDLHISLSEVSAIKLSAVMQVELKNIIKCFAKIDKIFCATAQNTKCFRLEGNHTAKLCQLPNKVCYFCKNKGQYRKYMQNKAEEEIDTTAFI